MKNTSNKWKILKVTMETKKQKSKRFKCLSSDFAFFLL